MPDSSAPERKSHLLLWIFGLLAAGVLILSLGGLIAARFLARNIEVIQTGNRVEVRTPVGSIRADKSSGDETGLPSYPGATLAEPAGTVELTAPDEENVAITAAKYRTDDPVEKVDAWYREKLGPEFEREGAGVMRRKKDIFGIQVRSDDVAFISEKDDYVLIVAIQKKFSRVEIAHVRIGKEEGR